MQNVFNLSKNKIKSIESKFNDSERKINSTLTNKIKKNSIESSVSIERKLDILNKYEAEMKKDKVINKIKTIVGNLPRKSRNEGVLQKSKFVFNKEITNISGKIPIIYQLNHLGKELINGISISMNLKKQTAKCFKENLVSVKLSRKNFKFDEKILKKSSTIIKSNSLRSENLNLSSNISREDMKNSLHLLKEPNSNKRKSLSSFALTYKNLNKNHETTTNLRTNHHYYKLKKLSVIGESKENIQVTEFYNNIHSIFLIYNQYRFRIVWDFVIICMII